MSVLRNIADGLRSLYRKEQVSRELEDELNGFLEMAVDEKVKQGMSRKDAFLAVRLERGSLDVTREIVWSARWESFVATLWRDLRFAAYSGRVHMNHSGFNALAEVENAAGIVCINGRREPVL